MFKIHQVKVHICGIPKCLQNYINEKLNDLYSSPNIVRVIKSGRMR